MNLIPIPEGPLSPQATWYLWWTFPSAFVPALFRSGLLSFKARQTDTERLTRHRHPPTPHDPHLEPAAFSLRHLHYDRIHSTGEFQFCFPSFASSASRWLWATRAPEDAHSRPSYDRGGKISTSAFPNANNRPYLSSSSRFLALSSP